MGQLFRIEQITHSEAFSHAIVTDKNNPKDKRYLYLEPFHDKQAKGLETDNTWTAIPDCPGYILRGESNLDYWKDGDIIREQFYPEESDNR